jgi:O-antigen ligase
LEAASAINYLKSNEVVNWPKIARIFVYLALVCLMFNGQIVNTLLCIATGLNILSKKGWHDLGRLIPRSLIAMSLLLLIVLAIGMFYSHTSWLDSLRIGNKYLKVGYLLILLPLFQDKSARKIAVLSFLIGICAAEVLMYCHYFDLINFGYDSTKHWLFVQDLDSGYLVSFAAFILASYSIDNVKYRWLTIPLLFFITIDILFLNQERTAYLIYLSLVGLLLWQRFDWRGLLTAALMLPLLFGGLYIGSHKFHDRVNQVASDIANYQKGNEATSIGLRMTFARYSFTVIKAHPLFGVGTGSFPTLYQQMNGPKIDENTWPTHPHNEYIAMLFQIGIVGLLIFCSWLMTQALAIARLPRPEKWYAQGLMLGFVLLSFCNASLQVNPAGNFYIVLLAIFLGGSIVRPQSKELL